MTQREPTFSNRQRHKLRARLERYPAGSSVRVVRSFLGAFGIGDLWAIEAVPPDWVYDGPSAIRETFPDYRTLLRVSTYKKACDLARLISREMGYECLV